jgi:hypothetical protein
MLLNFLVKELNLQQVKALVLKLLKNGFNLVLESIQVWLGTMVNVIYLRVYKRIYKM